MFATSERTFEKILWIFLGGYLKVEEHLKTIFGRIFESVSEDERWKEAGRASPLPSM